MEWKKVFKNVLSVLIVFGGFYIVFTGLDISMVVENLLNVNLVFIGAWLCFFMVTTGLKSYRWKEILNEKGGNLSFFKSYKIYFISFFVNSFVPARAGDFYRGYLSSDDGILDTSVLVVKDRLFDIFVLALYFSILAIIVFDQFLFYIIILSLFFAGFLGVYFFFNYFEEFPIMSDFYSKIRFSFIDNIETDKTFYFLGITVVIWFFDAIKTFMIFNAIGLDLSFVTAMFACIIWSLVSAIPLSPSGLGSVEAVLYVFFTSQGVPRELFTSYLVLARTLITVTSMFVGGFFYSEMVLKDISSTDQSS